MGETVWLCCFLIQRFNKTLTAHLQHKTTKKAFFTNSSVQTMPKPSPAINQLLYTFNSFDRKVKRLSFFAVSLCNGNIRADDLSTYVEQLWERNRSHLHSVPGALCGGDGEDLCPIVDTSLSPCNHNKHSGPSQLIPCLECKVQKRTRIYRCL